MFEELIKGGSNEIPYEDSLSIFSYIGLASSSDYDELLPSFPSAKAKPINERDFVTS